MRLPSFISRPLLIAAPWLCILLLWLAVRASDWSGRVRPSFRNTRRTMFKRIL